MISLNELKTYYYFNFHIKNKLSDISFINNLINLEKLINELCIKFNRFQM